MREKQIEEMARDMCHLSAECKTCQICNERYHGDDDFCYFQCVAKEIINHGFRKQSEVAKEIFDEIEKLVSTNKKTVGCATYDETIFYIKDFIEDLAELKKKYTGV